MPAAVRQALEINLTNADSYEFDIVASEHTYHMRTDTEAELLKWTSHMKKATQMSTSVHGISAEL